MGGGVLVVNQWSTWIAVAVLTVICLSAVVLGRRLRLFLAGRAGWKEYLFLMVWGALLVLAVTWLVFGLADTLTLATLWRMVEGALTAALAGLILSGLTAWFLRRHPQQRPLE